MEVKQCYKCKQLKPTSDFHTRRSERDGLNRACRECRKKDAHTQEYYIKNRDRIIKRIKRYREEHKEQEAERKRIYYKKNKKSIDQYHKEYYDKNKEKWGREKRLKNRYGLTISEYDAIFLSQSGVCAICKNPPPPHKKLVVDHNHKTGDVRALLCNNCNAIIGYAKEDTNILSSAIQYLIRTVLH